MNECVPDLKLLPTSLELLCVHLELRVQVIGLYLPVG